MARDSNQLYRIDDVLIRSGSLVGVVVVLAGLSWGSVMLQKPAILPQPPGLWPLWVLLAVAAPVGLLWTGFSIRARERRALAVMRLVERQPEIHANDLVDNSDLTRDDLARAIRDINGAGLAYLVWDRELDLVQDGRLRRSIRHSGPCNDCGAELAISVDLANPNSAQCPYCHAPLGAQDLRAEKQALLEHIALERRIAPPQPITDARKGKFSGPIFVLLLLIFWPAAVIYAMRHSSRLALRA